MIEVVVLLLMVPSLVPLTQAGHIFETRELNIVAVASLPNGTYTGVSARLSIRVECPGNGGVYVETLPLSQIDLQASTRIAAIVASRVAGIRFSSCDFLASIKADSPIVGGPSASAATAAAFAAALMGLPLRGDVVLTGMILPDGSIGPVGGLRAKLEAAAELGASFFLVPYGQTVFAETVTVPQVVGPVTIYTTRTVVVDLVEYGKRLGVQVIPVATIHEALNILTGGLYGPPKIVDGNVTGIRLTPTEEQQVKIWSETLKGRVAESLALGDLIRGDALSSLPRALRAYVESLLRDLESEINSLLSRAEGLNKQGYQYSAASTYFQALTYSLWRLYLLRSVQNTSVTGAIREDIEDRLNSVFQRVHGSLSEAGTLCLQSLDIAVAILNRAYEALIYLNKSLIESAVDRLTYYLAIADSRVTTAELWGTLLSVQYSEDSVCCSLNSKFIDDSTILLENLVYNIYTYIISFEGQVRIPVDTFNSMVTRINLMKSAEAPLDRLSLGIEALAYGYATLVSMFSQDINSTITSLNRTVSVELFSEPLVRCLPTSLVLYLELAATQEGSVVSKAYTLARISALVSFYADSLREGTAETARPEQPVSSAGNQATATQILTLVITVTRSIEPLTFTGIGILIGVLTAASMILILGKRAGNK